jgi:hypothetical protein
VIWIVFQATLASFPKPGPAPACSAALAFIPSAMLRARRALLAPPPAALARASAGEFVFESLRCLSCLLSLSVFGVPSRPCVPGSITNRTSQAVCNLCPAGRHQSQPGGTVCDACSPGQYSAEGKQDCSACAKGTVSQRSGASVCTSCLAGYYQPEEGQSACLICGWGYFSASSGQAGCIPAPEGSFTPSNRSSGFTACNAGTYSGRAASTCTQCQPVSALSMQSCFPRSILHRSAHDHAFLVVPFRMPGQIRFERRAGPVPGLQLWNLSCCIRRFRVYSLLAWQVGFAWCYQLCSLLAGASFPLSLFALVQPALRNA